MAAVIEPMERRTLLTYPITLGGQNFDSAFEVAATSDGGSIVAGIFTGTADFDPTSGTRNLTSVGDTDVFVARYSSSGALTWVKQFGGEEGELNDKKFIDVAIDPRRAGQSDPGVGLLPLDLGEFVTALTVEANGNVLVAIPFRGSADFDPGTGVRTLSSGGDSDFVNTAIVKLEPDGDFVYANQIDSRFTSVINDIASESSGNYVVTGYFTRSADFDPSTGVAARFTEGRQDIFVARYTEAGALTWVKQMAGDAIRRNRRNAGNAIALDSSSNVYLSGTFARTVDFDPGAAVQLLEAEGETDAFVQKLDADGDLIWIKSTGGTEFDGNLELALSPDGSVVTGGYFGEVVDADPGTAVRNVSATPEDIGDTAERTDLLISKLNGTDGSFIWARPLGGEGFETLGGLAVDSSGNVFTAGGFYASVDFNPGAGKFTLTSTLGVDDFDDPNDDDRDNSFDIFVQKLNSNGQFVFAKQIGAASDDWCTGLAIDSTGDLVLAGQIRGTVDYDPNSGVLRRRGLGKQDAFIAQLDDDGLLVI